MLRGTDEPSGTAIFPERSGSAAPRTDWPVVAVVVLGGVAASLQIGKGMIAIPLLQADLHWDLATLGWVTSVFAFLGLVGGVPAGALAARFGDKRLMVTGLFGLACGSMAGAAAPGLGLLLVARLVEGAGFLLISTTGPAILRRSTQGRHREIAMALWSCFMPAGMALAMLAGPLFDGWRAIWLAGAGTALLAAAAVALRVPAASLGAAPVWRDLVADALGMFRATAPLRLALCFAFYAMMTFALFSFLPVLLIERMQSSLAVVGPLSALAIASNIAGNLAAGVLLGRGILRAALIGGASIVMGVSAALIFLPLLPNFATFLFCMLFSAAGGLIPATLISSAALLAPRPSLVPATIGLIMQGSNLGQVAGPIAVGLVIARAGWPAAAMLVAALALSALLTALALRRDFRAISA
ncbi:MFS transporter [Bosea sp. AS-1]|uniref:MFS transporter n=1 Tax=Bosea sp. AS-1 TaxID=2015316 RepID=UPI0020C10F48|nr:MFS transporter [Bosea sp. AS-1]